MVSRIKVNLDFFFSLLLIWPNGKSRAKSQNIFTLNTSKLVVKQKFPHHNFFKACSRAQLWPIECIPYQSFIGLSPLHIQIYQDHVPHLPVDMQVFGDAMPDDWNRSLYPPLDLGDLQKHSFSLDRMVFPS